jgi:DNA-binding SARP family transcriptional activator
MLKVILLGTVSFSVGGKTLRSDLGNTGRLLACYLLEFIGRAHRRERLADVFWGDLEPDRARSALNTAIWRIRKLLEAGGKGGGRHLVTVGDDVIVEPSDLVQVDTHLLQSACCRRTVGWQAKGMLSENEEAEVSAAIECYGGPFLDGDDGEWILPERERLHCLFVRAALELMRVAARRGQHERALDLGRRILGSDPLREGVQRSVMLLLVLNGQRAEAIRTYQNLRSLLKRDLGIDPMPDTKLLYQEIVSGEIFAHLERYTVFHFGETFGRE